MDENLSLGPRVSGSLSSPTFTLPAFLEKLTALIFLLNSLKIFSPLCFALLFFLTPKELDQ